MNISIWLPLVPLPRSGCVKKDLINPVSRKVFTPDGVYVREIGGGGGGGGKGGGGKGGRFGGLCCDSNGFLMATRTEKGRSFIQVFR